MTDWQTRTAVMTFQGLWDLYLTLPPPIRHLLRKSIIPLQFLQLYVNSVGDGRDVVPFMGKAMAFDFIPDSLRASVPPWRTPRVSPHTHPGSPVVDEWAPPPGLADGCGAEDSGGTPVPVRHVPQPGMFPIQRLFQGIAKPLPI